MTRLGEDFFKRHTVEVARDLLGKKLIFGSFEGFITETEAYRGLDDEASHACKGPTPRSSIMFGPPGRAYIYFIYGMYYCLNLVTEEEGFPGAVLIRGMESMDGTLLKGPGLVCKHVGLTIDHNGCDLLTHSSFFIQEGYNPSTYEITSRIGIKKATEKPWRFKIKA